MLLSGVLASTPATANPQETSTRVVQLPMQTEGEFPSLTADALAAQLQGSVGPSLELVIPSEPTSCTGATCWASVAAAHEASFVLLPRAELRDRTYRLGVTIVDVRGETLADVEELCDVCARAEALETMATLGARAGTKMRASSEIPATLSIRSEPPGARVIVDGSVLGTTPLVVEVDAGEHTVRVEQSAHEAQQRRVVTHGGVEEQLEFALLPAPSRSRGWVTAGAVTAAMGGAVLATGATLAWLHDRPYRRRCSGNDIDINGTCRFRYDTLAGGVVGIISGVALIGTGVALVVRGRRSDRVALTPGRGLVLRFDHPAWRSPSRRRVGSGGSLL